MVVRLLISLFLILFLSLFQDYDRFWENFGKFLKLGCIEDHSNHKRLAPLLRFFSSQSENEFISLDEYLENMKPEQKAIYYIAADSVSSAKNTPFLERLLQKDYEVCFLMSWPCLLLSVLLILCFTYALLQVLFLVDSVDEVAINSLKTYKDKEFVDISKEDLDLG